MLYKKHSCSACPVLFVGLVIPWYIQAQKERKEEENSMLAFLGFLTVVLMLEIGRAHV